MSGTKTKHKTKKPFVTVPANFTQLPLDVLEGFEEPLSVDQDKIRNNAGKVRDSVKVPNMNVKTPQVNIQNDPNIDKAKSSATAYGGEANQRASDYASQIQNNQYVQSAEAKASEYANQAQGTASQYLNGMPRMPSNSNGKMDFREVKEQIKHTIQYFLNIFENMFSYIQPRCSEALTYTAAKFNLKDNPNSFAVIRRNFAYIAHVFISLFIAYNWFYLMYFKEDRFKFTLNAIKEYAPIIHFFLKYNFVPLVTIDHILFNVVPYYLKAFFGLVPAFYMIWRFLNNAFVPNLDVMFDNLTTALHMQKGAYDSQIVASMILFGLLSTIMVLPFFEKIQRIIQYMYSPVTTLITFILRIVLWSIPFTWVAVLTTCLYLIYVSFFAIIANEGYNAFKVWKDLDHYINTGFGKHDPCESEPPPPDPFKEDDRKTEKEFRPYDCNTCGSSSSILFWLITKIYKTTKFAIQFKLKHKLSFILLMTLFYCIFDFLYSMGDDSLTQTFMVVVSLTVGMIVFIRVYLNFEHEMELGRTMSSMGEKQAHAEAECSDIKLKPFDMDFIHQLASPFDKLKEFGMNNFGAISSGAANLGKLGLNAGLGGLGGLGTNGNLAKSIDHLANAIEGKMGTGLDSGTQSALEQGLAEGLKQALGSSVLPKVDIASVT